MKNRESLFNAELGAVFSDTDEDTPSDEVGYRKLLHRETKENLKGRTQDRKQRKSFAGKIYRLTLAWLAVIVVILFCQGIGDVHGWFRLSDSVLIALVSGASVNIIGLMAIVIRYLFPAQKK